jgi:hypothetical protein
MGSLQHKQPPLVHKPMQLSLNCHKPEQSKSLGFQVCLLAKAIVTELSLKIAYSEICICANLGIFKIFFRRRQTAGTRSAVAIGLFGNEFRCIIGGCPSSSKASDN